MIFENDYLIIKPYKNRNKSELYIHNQELRSELANTPIPLINEDLTSVIYLNKKVLFHSKAYGNIAKEAVNQYVNSQLKTQYAEKINEFFNAKIDDIPPHIDLTNKDVKEGYYNHILKELAKIV